MRILDLPKIPMSTDVCRPPVIICAGGNLPRVPTYLDFYCELELDVMEAEKDWDVFKTYLK